MLSYLEKLSEKWLERSLESQFICSSSQNGDYASSEKVRCCYIPKTTVFDTPQELAPTLGAANSKLRSLLGSLDQLRAEIPDSSVGALGSGGKLRRLATISSVAVVVPFRLPRYRSPIAEEATGGSGIRECCSPHRRASTLLDRSRGTRAAHIGADPSWADGVDEDAGTAQLGGQDAGDNVKASFGDAVTRGTTAHIVQGSEAA